MAPSILYATAVGPGPYPNPLLGRKLVWTDRLCHPESLYEVCTH